MVVSFHIRRLSPSMACLAWLLTMGAPPLTIAAELKGNLALESVPEARLTLTGVVGERVRANVDHWLLVAPRNNPGLLDMFARRDTDEKLDLVPWAGEFVGKYLISGVQALRMSDEPKLQAALRQVVDRLLALQADDGYLGPWRKKDRLRGQWDLWGHYHVMLGLMLWAEHTGDKRADVAAQRIADLVCQTCLGTNFRVIDAGSAEMNMGIIHGLTLLYEKTGQPRYLQLAREVLKDFERAGDYYRTGLEGKEYFRTPRPRWESLHSLQGLAELYRITGDESFRQSFLHHWASIRRFDLRNTGGFSAGEQATGNPYTLDAIETCCVVAWQTIMLDALRLSGDCVIADDLESSTLNAMLGAQHPSGAWCTYNTPLAGQRIPSHIDINFQARPGAPHLNCCSVNGPRGYGSLSEWGWMRQGRRLAVNYYGPSTAALKLADGTPVTIVQETDYPLTGRVTVKVAAAPEQRFTLALRIPAWSRQTQVSLNGQALPNVQPGRYLELDRTWAASDRIVLDLDLSLRYEAGDLQQAGLASLYRGPILLTWDSRFGKGPAPQIDIGKMAAARVVPLDESLAKAAGAQRPWLVVEVPTADGKTARLIDFASAGATTVEGKPLSTYTSWLPAKNLVPPRPVPWQPADRALVGTGPIRFVWRKPATEAAAPRKHTIVISESPTFDSVTLRYGDAAGTALLLPLAEAAKLKVGTPYYWKVIARNACGETESLAPYKQFRIDPTAPPLDKSWPYGERESDQMLVAVPLDGQVKPSYGTLLDAQGWKAAPGRNGQPATAVELDGKGGLIRYRVQQFPDESFTVSLWFSVVTLPPSQYGQIFCAWANGLDDPLRIFVSGGKLAARIEAGQFINTESLPIEVGRWYHVAAVKQAAKLTLYVDGQARSTIAVPAIVNSNASDFALGGNPHFQGAEFLNARVADLKFYLRACSPDEIRELSAKK